MNDDCERSGFAERDLGGRPSPSPREEKAPANVSSSSKADEPKPSPVILDPLVLSHRLPEKPTLLAVGSSAAETVEPEDGANPVRPSSSPSACCGAKGRRAGGTG
jgi:hypothetical protein